MVGDYQQAHQQVADRCHVTSGTSATERITQTSGGRVDMSEEYKSALQRLNKANTIEELARLERSLERIYNAGFFTVSEYGKLDLKLIHKQFDIHAMEA